MTIRRRSHWAWGWEDAFPSPDERRNLGQMVSAMLGFAPLQPREPVALEAVELPAPTAGAPDADEAPACVSDAAEARLRHTYGRAYPDVVRGFHGRFDRPPDLVATPADEAEVAACLDWADTRDVVVIPYGGGSSVVGGVEAPGPGEDRRPVLSLDLTRLDRVLEVDATSRSARIQAGVMGPALEAQLAGHGLTLRHFPQSFEFSTLGGWIVTRSGGHYATGRTHIDDFVAGVRVLTPRGPMQTRRLPASGAGPDPVRTICGSEGILGVVTEAWMRLQERPVWRSSASFRFDAFDDAVAACRTLAQSGLEPANCRLLDRREATLHGVVMDGSSVLIVGFESAYHPTAELMGYAEAICRDHGGACPDGVRHRDASAQREDGEGSSAAGAWRDAFLQAPYLQGSMVSLGVIADTFETACTWGDFPELHAGVIARVRQAMREVCGAGFVSCRFTHVYPDGPAPYYTFVAPAPSSPSSGNGDGALAAWAEIKDAASRAVVDLGGTITHHHAVGRIHRPYWERERPELWAAMLRAAKGAVDPRGILNPGVLLASTPTG